MEPFIGVLGSPVVRIDDRRLEPAATKQSALLLYLACAEGWVARDDLLYLLWPDSDERSGRNSLRQALHRLKDVAWAHDVEREQGRVRWTVPTDLSRFRAARGDGKEGEAVRAYRGPLLDGFRLTNAPEFDAWLELTRDALHHEWREAAWACATSLRETGNPRDAASLLEAVVLADPLDEAAVRGLMAARWEAGARTQALATYESFRRRLEEELGVEPEPRTRELFDEIRAGRDPSRPIDATAERGRRSPPDPDATRIGDSVETRTSLPQAATPFVGRRTELEALGSALMDHGVRLLNIVAPGGMGKTRLALELAHGIESRFRDGASFVSFAATESPEQMPSVVADALGLALAPVADPRDQIVGFLAQRHMLLVLDNLEQLKEDLSLVDTLLDRCPDVVLVTTARERLELKAETTFDLQGLDHEPWTFGAPTVEPPSGGRATAGAVGRGADLESAGDERSDRVRSDAAELFLQAAARVRGADATHERRRGPIDRICSLVRGMPLAITLAAAWLRVLSVEEIAAELERGTGLLESHDADGDPRHRSIRHVFDATWSRLRKGEREAWLRLAIFEGGFQREAAREVADVGLPLLLALTNKSIVTRVTGSRFDFHPLVRQYALDRRSEVGDLSSVRERHARWYLEWLARTAPLFRGPEQVPAFASVTREMPNIRVAWNTAVDSGDAALLGLAAPALWSYFDILRHEEAFIPFALRVVDALGTPSEVEQCAADVQRAVAWVWPAAIDHGGGYFERLGTSLEVAVWIGDAELAARAHAEFASVRAHDKDGRHRDRAIAAYRELGDQHGIARVRQVAGWQLVLAGEYAEAQTLLEQAAARFRVAGDKRLEGAALDDIVVIDILRGDLERADERIARVEAIHQDVGIASTRAQRAGTRRWIAIVREDWETAKRYQDEYLAFEVHVAGDHFPMTAGMLRGELHLKRGELGLAREEIGSALEVLKTFRSPGFSAAVIHLFKARIEMRDGRHRVARPHLREALRTSIELDAPRFVMKTAVATAELLMIEGRDELALDIMAAACSDPATEFETRREAERLTEGRRDLLQSRSRRDRAWLVETLGSLLDA